MLINAKQITLDGFIAQVKKTGLALPQPPQP